MSEQNEFPKLNPQIIKISGNKTFFEVLNTSFSFANGKVQINFYEYDINKPAKERMVKHVPIYFNFADFLLLTQNIISGRFMALAKAEKERAKKAGDKYCGSIFHHMGGTSVERLAKKEKSRPDGMAESRIFRITPGDKKPWIFSAEKGPGQETETGLIAPKGKPEEIIRVPLETDGDFKKFALISQAHVTAYLTASYQKYYHWE